MNDVWFTTSEPVRGVCIRSWLCDQEGSVIEDLRIDSDDYIGSTQGISASSRQSKFQVNFGGNGNNGTRDVTSERSFATGADLDMVEKLNALIKDAKDAFHTVLTRNADLEKEIDASRILPTTPSQGIPTPRTTQTRGVSSTPVVPMLSLPSRHQRSFDISTPPTYKENVSLLHRPSQPSSGSAKTRRPSTDSGSIRRGISVFNS